MEFNSLELGVQHKLYYLLTISLDWEGDGDINEIKVLICDNLACAYARQLEEIGILTLISKETDTVTDCNDIIIGMLEGNRYKIEVQISSNTLQSLRERTYFISQTNYSKLLQSLKIIMVKSALETFKKYLQERGLELNYNSTYDLLEFAKLFEYLSYSQVVYLCYKVAVSLSDKVIRNALDKKMAETKALKEVVTYYNRAKQNGWNICNTLYGELEEELDFFLYYVLGGNYDILGEKATVENVVKYPLMLTNSIV